MKRWLETAKTVILSLLVITSFCLTGMIWINQPNLQFIEPAKYTESKPVLEKSLEKMITPSAVVFHYGQDRHTKAVATDGQYSMIMREMPRWIFLDFTPYTLTHEKWEEIAREKLGLEVRFRSNLPLSAVGRLVTFREEYNIRLMGIDRIWLYHEPEEDLVYALFLSGEEEKVMRSRTSISPKDLRESYLANGNQMPEQIMKVVIPAKYNTSDPESKGYSYWHMYYLPKHQIRMQQFRFSYTTVPTEQLMEAYFLDPTLVRQIMERDKTVIYTDGSRSIQVRSEQKAITFTDPAYQQRILPITDEEKLQSAVSFVNKHLGWLDDYYLEDIKKSYNDKDSITFRQYIGAYPLVSKGEKPIDTIEIISEAGQVVTMNRSMLDMETYITNRDLTVMSGPELYQLIRDKNLANTEEISNTYLAYQTFVSDDYIELIPTWVVEVPNQPTLLIPAKSNEGGGRANGLE